MDHLKRTLSTLPHNNISNRTSELPQSESSTCLLRSSQCAAPLLSHLSWQINLHFLFVLRFQLCPFPLAHCKINPFLNFISVLIAYCMWVKTIHKTMTEHSGQPDPAEVVRRTLSEQSHLIQAHDSTLWSLAEQLGQTNLQIEQLASMLQHTLSSVPIPAAEGATAPPVTQQLPHSRDITSPNPEKYSGPKGWVRQ
ncbi:hypothetical protein AMECASPLE_023799 [Ameca splendens]|uniref:Uncharacterized protein n=1 Tax=Ameca splendens TaxID=208324 RepID=A0ABV0YR52_9TELE